MKQYDLSKKNSFWSMYGKRIIKTVYTILFSVLFISTITMLWQNRMLIKNFIVTNVALIFDCISNFWIKNQEVIFVVIKNTMLSILILFVIFMCCCAVKYVYRYIMFFHNQQYIPLTKEELQKNGITNIEDYNTFLEKYLYNFYPNKKLRKMIVFSAFKYLLPETEQLAILSQENLKSVLAYEESYDINIENEFVNGMVEKISPKMTELCFLKYEMSIMKLFISIFEYVLSAIVFMLISYKAFECANCFDKNFEMNFVSAGIFLIIGVVGMCFFFGFVCVFDWISEYKQRTRKERK